MKAKLLLIAILAISASFSLVSASVVTYVPTDTSGWVTDRYAPDSFTYNTDHFELTISSDDSDSNRPPAYSSSFYRTQGVTHDASSEGNPWIVTGSFEIKPEMLTGLARGGIWIRTSFDGTEANAKYNVLEYFRYDLNDPLNASSPNITSGFRFWNSFLGWQVTVGPATVGLHTFEFQGNAGGVTMILDGAGPNSVSYTDVYNTDLFLTDVFLEGYNLYSPGDVGTTTYSFENISFPVTTVPEPNAFILLGAGLLGFVLRRRRPVAA